MLGRPVNRRGGSVQDEAQGSAGSLEGSGARRDVFEEMRRPVGVRGPGDFQGKVFKRSQDPRSEAQGRSQDW